MAAASSTCSTRTWRPSTRSRASSSPTSTPRSGALPPFASVIGLGGGQASDVAKYLAWSRGRPLFQVPTAMTTNAPFAHRAVLRQGGTPVSLGWGVPEAVYVDIDVIRTAPALLNRSGVADVLCYHTAHFDWKLAHDSGREERRWPYDARLVDEARQRFDAVLADLDEIREVSDRGIRTLMLAHRWGGAAFHAAGWNARHMDGVDHAFLYGLEHLTGRHFIHGQAVGLGTYLGLGPPGQRAGSDPRRAPSRRRRHPSRGDGDRLGGGRDGDAAPGLVRPLRGSPVHDRRRPTGHRRHRRPHPGPDRRNVRGVARRRSTPARRRVHPMKRSPRHTGPRTLAALIASIALAVAACGSAATPAPTAAPATPGATSAPASAPGSAPASAASGTKHVSILNKDMTDDEIKAEIQKEGGLVVGNWTYTATDELVKQFQDYVKATYGVDIKLTYVGSQSPSEYLDQALRGQAVGHRDALRRHGDRGELLGRRGRPGPRRRLPAVRPDPEPEAPAAGLRARQHRPRVPAPPLIALLYNKDKAPFVKSFKDLADPRLKGKVTLPPPGDISSGGFLLALAAELGKDYKDPNQMKEVVDWVIKNIGPNLIKYTTTQSTLSSLIESGARPRPRSTGMASPASSTSVATRTSPRSSQRPSTRSTATSGSPREPAPGAGPDLRELAPRSGRPVPQHLEHGPRALGRALRGPPRARRTSARSPTGSRRITTRTT